MQSRVSGTMSMDMRCGAVLLHLLRDHRAGALLEPGADFGERLDLLDGDVGLAHALVVQHGLLATAACRSRRRELQAVRGRQHRGRDGRWVAPAD